MHNLQLISNHSQFLDDITGKASLLYLEI